MNIRTIGAPFAVLTVAALSLTACAANEGTPAAPSTGGSTAASSNLSGTLTGKGASSMQVAQQAWVAGFQEANPSVTVNYAPDGSGAGRDAFIAGAADFAGSDRALKDEEMGAGKFVGCADTSNALNLPVYISPIAVVYNVQGVTDLKLDAATIAGIFAGQITNWNDAKIAALNPGVTLPDQNVTPVHRSDDSGTTENFTDYLHQAAPDVWTEKASGTWPTAFPGEAAKGTSGVVDAVTNGNGTIGYADESQAGSLGKAEVKVGSDFFGPTAEAAAALVDNAAKADGRAEHDWALKLDRTAEGQYPIALISYAIVCEEYADSAKAELVKAYLGYMVSADGQAAAQAQAGNAPLSSTMTSNIEAAVASVK